MSITTEQKHAIREVAEYAKMLEENNDFSENRTIDDGYLDGGGVASLTIDALHEISSIQVEAPRTVLTEEQLREAIKVAIGYDPVRLSIRDHPEITWEYRTAHDRDGLVERISAALIPLVGATPTAYPKPDLTKYDEYGMPYTDRDGKNLDDGWG